MFCCAAALLLALSACGGTIEPLPELKLSESSAVSGTEGSGTESSGTSAAEDIVVDQSEYEDNLDGLCKYMEASKAVIKSDNENSFVEMSYKEIGAIGGFRYRFTYHNSTVQAEFYEFDPENLDEKGKLCLDSVREKGYFEILGDQVRAALHPSEKYLMIYTDPNAEKREENAAQQKRVEELFLGFKN